MGGGGGGVSVAAHPDYYTPLSRDNPVGGMKAVSEGKPPGHLWLSRSDTAVRDSSERPN